jgi:hypothetical protein
MARGVKTQEWLLKEENGIFNFCQYPNKKKQLADRQRCFFLCRRFGGGASSFRPLWAIARSIPFRRPPERAVRSRQQAGRTAFKIVFYPT